MFAKLKKIWSAPRTQGAILFIVIMLIILVGGYFLQDYLTSRTDKKFDEIEQAKIEQIKKDEVVSAIHEAIARAQEIVIRDLQKQVTSFQNKIDINNKLLSDLTRSQKNVEKTTRDNLKIANSNMDVTARCERICTSAKALGLIPQTARCDCQ